MIGIYKITNILNNHCYIGQSINVEKRWKQHKSEYLNNQSKLLYQAFKKHGIENFNFEIIEECQKEKLNDREIYWIQYYNSYLDGYNMTKGGDGTRGEENGNSKLTEEDIYFIRNKYAEGACKVELYRQYFQNKIGFNGFCAIWQGKTWPHIMPEVFTNSNKEKMIHRSKKGQNVGAENPSSKLTECQVRQVISLLETSTKSQTQIAKDFGVSYNTINGINRCKNWNYLHHYHSNIRDEYLKEHNKNNYKGEMSTTAKINDEMALQIISLLERDKRSLVQLSKDLNVSIYIIQGINNCKSWKHLHNYKQNIRKEFKERGDAINEDTRN